MDMLQTGSCGKHLQGPTSTVPCRLPMGCRKEVPISMHPNVQIMVAHICEVLTVLVLCCTSIREKNLLGFLYHHTPGSKIPQAFSGKGGRRIGNNDVAGTIQLFFIPVIADERVDSGSSVIPMKTLNFVLNYETKVEKSSNDYKFPFLWALLFLQKSGLHFGCEVMDKEFLQHTNKALHKLIYWKNLGF